MTAPHFLMLPLLARRPRVHALISAGYGVLVFSVPMSPILPKVRASGKAGAVHVLSGVSPGAGV